MSQFDRTDDPTADAADVRRLLAKAGPRPEVPAEVLSRLRDGSRQAWREAVAARQPQRGPSMVLALAATLLLALSLALLWRAQSPPPVELAAAVERWSGAVAGIDLERAAPIELTAGSRLETAATADAGLALRLLSGHSVRLGPSTRVEMIAGDTVELEAGMLYVDSGGAGRAMVVRAPFGRVTDVGTQFEVRAGGAEGGGWVRVREGTIEMTVDDERWIAAAGEQLTMTAGGEVEAGRFEPDPALWEWALALAPPFDLDGATLGAFVDWYQRETGDAIVFDPANLEATARGIVLSGTVDHLDPRDALAVVLPAAGLADERSVGRVTVYDPAARPTSEP